MSGCHIPYVKDNTINEEDKEAYLRYKRLENLIDFCQTEIEILFERISNLDNIIKEHFKKGCCQCNTKKN